MEIIFMNNTKEIFDFFISHSKETKQLIVIPLAQCLKSIGIDVWIDRKEILVGNHIYSEIQDAITRSKFCIAVIDQSFLKRTWPMKELELFNKKNNTSIIPIFVDLEKAIVYNEIPWLDGIAFEKMHTEPFDLNVHMSIFCRIISRLFKDNNTNKNSIEKTFESITKYDFPCKETLSSLIYFSKYNSSNLRLASIDLCNIGGIIYAISKTYSIPNNVITQMFLFSNILRDYCFNVNFIPDYNIYIGMYNAIVASLTQLVYWHIDI